MPRVDLYCKTGNGTLVDVEIQMAKADGDQLTRVVYYGSKLFSGAGKRGKKIKNIPNVYQIMLSDFYIFKDAGGQKHEI